jgi:hypothetical protein
LWDGKFREPDIVFLLAQHADRRGNKYWRGADLVMEVVSEDDPDRDLVTKRVEYAQAGICEYWLLDPRDRTVTVLALDAAARRVLRCRPLCARRDGAIGAVGWILGRGDRGILAVLNGRPASARRRRSLGRWR